MKLGVFLSTLIAAGAHAASHGVGHNHLHKVRNVNVASRDDTAVLSDRAVTAADCDKGALINKLLMTVPTSLVSAMLTEPTPFHNDNPPEFWNKLDDHEKECMAALWPNDKRQATANAETVASAAVSTTEPCTETTVTSTITQTLTVTMDVPSPSSTPALSEVNTTTVAVTSTKTSTVAVISVESSIATTAPYGNATTTTSVIPSGTEAANTTSSSLPEFTAGQDMVVVNMSTMMAALVAILVCSFA